MSQHTRTVMPVSTISQEFDELIQPAAAALLDALKETVLTVRLTRPQCEAKLAWLFCELWDRSEDICRKLPGGGLKDR